MPELPEVETIRRQLESLVVGKTISSIEVLNPGSFRADPGSLIGKTVTAVERKGKVLIVTSSRGRAQRGRGDLNGSGPDNLYIHLKMSGRLEFVDQNISNQSKKARPFPQRPGLSRLKHLRVAITFTDNSCLLFHDQRKFGWITDDPTVLPRGADALDPQLTPEILAEILSSSNRPIKQILLDQSKIAGIGNIYASEMLWEAKISPWAKFREEGRGKREEGGENQLGKFRKLPISIRKVLLEAIETGGSTMDDKLYRHVSGQTGDYWSRRRVYDREGEPCRRPACRKTNVVIQKTVIGQRSTYFCPSCQSI